MEFENFYEIVDYYKSNNSNNYFNNKICFDCPFGSIEFYKPNNTNNTNNTNTIIVHSIYINEEYRRQGLCTEFIKYLIDNSGKKKIIIQSVLSKILYNFLLRFNYKNKKFILKKEGFVYSI